MVVGAVGPVVVDRAVVEGDEAVGRAVIPQPDSTRTDARTPQTEPLAHTENLFERTAVRSTPPLCHHPPRFRGHGPEKYLFPPSMPADRSTADSPLGIMGSMPELPEVQALVEFLDNQMRGRRVERCELGAIAALKTFDPRLDDLVGRPVSSCSRRGKFVCLDFDGLWLVVHLALGGWVKWWDSLPATKARPSRSPIALRVGLSADDFAPSPGFDVTEMGTEKRLALWVVHRPEEVEPLAALGPDPLAPGFDVDTLAAILSRAPGTIKNALSTQSLIAGVGNAYSDEILHAAKLSPFKPAAKLSADELARAFEATVTILTEATERASGRTAKELKAEKKRTMRVHGRTGQDCPVCGDVVREVSFATKSLQYCATCQTGGKPLADRRLSRLLK